MSPHPHTPPGVNHIGHFVLTNELMPVLLRSAPSRVVNVSSLASAAFAPAGGILFDDLRAEKSYNPVERYGNSKLANVLHAVELQRRYGGRGVTAVSLHPGGVTSTNLMRSTGLGVVLPILGAVASPSKWWALSSAEFKSIPQGVSTTILCALAPDVKPGERTSNGGRGVLRVAAWCGSGEEGATLCATRRMPPYDIVCYTPHATNCRSRWLEFARATYTRSAGAITHNTAVVASHWAATSVRRPLTLSLRSLSSPCHMAPTHALQARTTRTAPWRRAQGAYTRKSRTPPRRRGCGACRRRSSPPRLLRRSRDARSVDFQCPPRRQSPAR